MKWEIDDSLPIHTQLVDEIIKRIIAGEYPLGERIPSVRDLAFEARVNPNTMQKALAELENRKIIFTQRTSGKYVTEDKELIKSVREKLSSGLVGKFVKDMRDLDFSLDDIVLLLGKEQQND